MAAKAENDKVLARSVDDYREGVAQETLELEDLKGLHSLAFKRAEEIFQKGIINIGEGHSDVVRSFKVYKPTYMHTNRTHYII